MMRLNDLPQGEHTQITSTRVRNGTVPTPDTPLGAPPVATPRRSALSGLPSPLTRLAIRFGHFISEVKRLGLSRLCSFMLRHVEGTQPCFHRELQFVFEHACWFPFLKTKRCSCKMTQARQRRTREYEEENMIRRDSHYSEVWQATFGNRFQVHSWLSSPSKRDCAGIASLEGDFFFFSFLKR